MRTRRTMIAAATGAALVAGLAVPATAGTTTGSTGMGSATVTVPNQTWTSYDCQHIPVTATVSGIRGWDVDWDIDLDARRAGSGSLNSWAWLDGNGNGSDRDSFFLCPWEGSGRYNVTGDVEFLDWDTYAEASAPLSTSFTMSKMTSTATISKIRKPRWGTKVIGTVKARSATLGAIGARGPVVIQAKKPGKRWVRVDWTTPNDQGRYVVATYKKYPKGTRFKAVYRGDEATNRDVSPVKR